MTTEQIERRLDEMAASVEDLADYRNGLQERVAVLEGALSIVCSVLAAVRQTVEEAPPVRPAPQDPPSPEDMAAWRKRAQGLWVALIGINDLLTVSTLNALVADAAADDPENQPARDDLDAIHRLALSAFKIAERGPNGPVWKGVD